MCGYGGGVQYILMIVCVAMLVVLLVGLDCLIKQYLLLFLTLYNIKAYYNACMQAHTDTYSHTIYVCTYTVETHYTGHL